MTEPSRCYVVVPAGTDTTGWPTCGHVDLGASGVVVEVLDGSWSAEVVDLGGVTVLRRTVPGAVAAAKRLPPDGPVRTRIKVEAERLRAGYLDDAGQPVGRTIARIQALAASEGVDVSGLSLKGELVAELLRARHPEWGGDVPRERLAVLRDRMLAATPAEIARWAGRRGIDVTGAADLAEAAGIILAALGYAL